MNSCLHQLMDTVDAAGIEPKDFLADSFSLFALSISKLDPEAREHCLLRIECGELRDAVKKFDSPYPKANGGGCNERSLGPYGTGGTNRYFHRDGPSFPTD
jgi:hypothetical protein